MLPETPVLENQLVRAPYQTVALDPAGIRQTAFSLAHKIDDAGGVDPTTVIVLTALVLIAPELSKALAVKLRVPTGALVQLIT